MAVRLLLSIVVLAATSVPLAAEPILIEQFHLTLPDSVADNASVRFVDVNRDGRVDILATRTDRIASVDIESGQIIDNFYPVVRNGDVRSVVGHFNSDDRLDMAVVKRLPNHDDSLGIIIWLSDLSGFDIDTTIIPFSINDSIKYVLEPSVLDQNDDGIDEIYAGYYWENCILQLNDYFCYHDSVTFVYDPSGGQLTTGVTMPEPFTHTYQTSGGRIDVALSVNTSAPSVFGPAVVYDTYFQVAIYRDLVYSGRHTFLCAISYSPSDPDFIHREATYWASWLSNLVGSADQPELVIAQANSIWSLYGYEEPQSSRELRCFTISDADSLIEVWNVSWDYIYGIFSLPDRPDVFYTVELNNTVIERSAVTGLPVGSGTFSGPRPEDYVGLVEYDGDELVAFHKDADVWFYQVGVATDVGEPGRDGKLPGSFVLSDPYPNPFNAEVSIPISISTPGELRVDLYNVVGRRVESLFDGPVGSGDMTIRWQAGEYSSGIYFVRVRMGDDEASAKVLLVK